MLDLMALYTWSDQSNHKVASNGFVDEFRYLADVITADNRDDNDIGKLFRRKNVQ